MKKILIALALVCVLTGCDGNTKNLSCTQKTDANGLTTKTSYDIEYAGDDVKYLTITYDYSQGNNNDMDGVNADTDGITENNNNITIVDIIYFLLFEVLLFSTFFCILFFISNITPSFHSNYIFL